jgi:hypothetical protein
MTTNREAKPGELREINVLEFLEKRSRRTDLRLDVQRLLENLSPTAQVYVKHLVMSGPSSIKAAAKACELKAVEVEAALTELETAIAAIRK